MGEIQRDFKPNRRSFLGFGFAIGGTGLVCFFIEQAILVGQLITLKR